MFTDRIISTLEESQAIIPHGSSQDGNPVSCCAALATLDYVTEHGIINHTQRVGSQLLSQLRETLCHRIIGDIRGIGLMLSIELIENTETKTKTPLSFPKVINIMFRCLQKGLLVYPFDKGISLFPPLLIASQDIMEIVSIIDEVLSTENILD